MSSKVSNKLWPKPKCFGVRFGGLFKRKTCADCQTPLNYHWSITIIKSNQITFSATSPQHVCLGEWNSWERAPDSAKTIYIWTVHTYRLIQKTMCRMHIHIVSTHSVLLDILAVINTHYTQNVHILHYVHLYTQWHVKKYNNNNKKIKIKVAADLHTFT